MALTDAQKLALEQQLGTGVKRTSVDGLTVDTHSIKDIIEALRYAATCDAVANTSGKPFRLQVFRSPGVGAANTRPFSNRNSNERY